MVLCAADELSTEDVVYAYLECQNKLEWEHGRMAHTEEVSAVLLTTADWIGY